MRTHALDGSIGSDSFIGRMRAGAHAARSCNAVSTGQVGVIGSKYNPVAISFMYAA